MSPSTALIDVPVSMSLRGLDSRAHVTISASAVDSAGTTWASAASFTASSSGVVSPADPMSLFKTMKPESGSATVFRSPPAGVVRRTCTVARDGVHGTLFLPRDDGSRHSAVLMFGGSEGGESTDFNAGLHAGHGHPVLSIAYFDAPARVLREGSPVARGRAGGGADLRVRRFAGE